MKHIQPDTALVVHLVNVPDFWKGQTDPRLVLGGIGSGLVIVIAAAFREATTGEGNLLADIVIAVAIIGLLLLSMGGVLASDFSLD